MTDVRVTKNWAPSAQELFVAEANQVEASTWRPFFCRRPEQGQTCDGLPHDDWDWPHARSDQHPPPGEWLTWLLRGGRGSGKTRTGSEWTHRRTRRSPRIGLVATTGPDARDIMIEGESGILATSPPGRRPQWEPSKKKLTWPNGAIGSVYSGEEPDRLRGPEHCDVWIDEPAHYPLIDLVWDNLLLGLRQGEMPRICATSTPKPTPWIKALIRDATTVSVVTSTYANLANLAPTWRRTVLDRYEGTRKGRQELYGEILDDVEGAMWKPEMIEDYRVKTAPPLERIVIGVDPAGTANARSDETGIIVVGKAGGEFYVLVDRSGRYSPHGWAKETVSAYNGYSGDRVVIEKNYGGDMVRTTLQGVDPDLPITEVTSRRGKALRADPVVALYEQGRVHHVGLFNDLEDQMTSWVPGNTSPDRLDALVHAITYLMGDHGPSQVATPDNLPRLS